MPTSSTPDFGTVDINRMWTVAIVRALWHDELTSSLAESARKELLSLGLRKDNVEIFSVPGTFELPLACQKTLKTFDAVIAFGVVVEGETEHAELISEAAASGLMQVQLAAEKPVVFEVLSVKKYEDAKKRATGKGNKGPIAARTAVTSLAKLRELQ